MNTKIRLITRIAFGFRSPDALIALAMLSLGGLTVCLRPHLPEEDRPGSGAPSPLPTQRGRIVRLLG